MRHALLRLALLACLPLSLAWSAGRVAAAHQESPAEEFRSAAAGFAISKPAADWTLETKPGDFGISSLGMSPKSVGAAVKFSVEISPAGKLDPSVAETQRDSLLEQVESIETIREAKPLQLEVAQRTVPGLQLDQESAGVVYHLRQAYLVENGLLYKFQFYAPKSDYKSYADAFAEALSSFELIPFDEGTKREMNLVFLAAKCGSEVEQFDDWNAASKKASDESKNIVVIVQAVSGFDMDNRIARGPLMDPDVVGLLQTRFVVLQWRKGMGAPFEDQDVFGMSASTFGSGMLVVEPDGNVVKQLFVLRGTAVYDVLLSALQEGGSDPGPRPKLAQEDRIEFLLKSGQLTAAENELAKARAGGGSARGAMLLAELHRLRRDGPKALDAVANALRRIDKRPTPDRDLRAECQLLHAKLLTGTNDAETAEAIVDAMLQNDGVRDSPSIRAEALFLKGALRLQAKERASAEDAWGTMIEEHPESRWSWLAASGIGSSLWELDLTPSLGWPSPDDRRLIELPRPASAKRGKATIQSMIQEGAEYLLDTQKADGSWASASSYGTEDVIGHDFDLAATAIGGRALLRMPKNTKARVAAFRAMNWMLKRREYVEELESRPIVFMDYAVWSKSYGVFFLADCLDAELGDESEVRGLLSKYLDDLVERQQPNGGWSYYLSGTAGGAPAPQSISFTTATVVLAIERALESGFELPESVLSRGLDCLEAMRSPHGTFGYFLNGRDVETGERASDGIEASAARGPVCSLALIRGQRESGKDLTKRLELYVEQIATFGDQRRKALMHAGEHTQGSHYLMFDYSTAAEALLDKGSKGVPKKLLRKARQTILEQLRACQNQNGSFVDNPLIGADTGTGLALLGLFDLSRL
jgi:hypothetical protein